MERSQFEREALEHLDSLYRLAMQLARDPDFASDLVQETYLRALRASDSFEDQGGGMRPWLFTILYNVFRTKIKREKKAPVAVEEFFDADESTQAPDEAPPAWDLGSLDWDHVDERLKKAIEGLKPEYRTILLLWGVEGLKYREIAEVVGTPIGTVMSRLHRARKILADSLADLPEELGFRASEQSA